MTIFKKQQGDLYKKPPGLKRRPPQSVVNILIILSSAGAAWPIHYFEDKNVINFVFKLEKIVQLHVVIDTGREFQILGPW